MLQFSRNHRTFSFIRRSDESVFAVLRRNQHSNCLDYDCRDQWYIQHFPKVFGSYFLISQPLSPIKSCWISLSLSQDLPAFNTQPGSFACSTCAAARPKRGSGSADKQRFASHRTQWDNPTDLHWKLLWTVTGQWLYRVPAFSLVICKLQS